MGTGRPGRGGVRLLRPVMGRGVWGLAGAAAVVAGAGVANMVPAVSSWRALRCRATPSLAGLGHPGHLALTFDDGPDPASTPAFLDELDRLGWRATFFMLGTMVRRHPALSAEVAARGHEIGVHGDTHASHLRRPPSRVGRDVERGRDAIVTATGSVPVWFRPPYGAVSCGSLLAAHRLALRPVLWTAWGRDWRAAATPASVVADLGAGIGPGGTVLLHDSDCTSAPGSWRSALGSLPGLAEMAARRGLAVGPLGEHGIGAPGGRRIPA